MPKLEREAFGSYLDTKFNKKIADAAQAEWEIIGDDIDDMSVALNSETEQKKNILGQTKTVDKGYSPTMNADPFYANTDSKLYPKIRDIAYDRLKGDACKTLLLEVTVEDTDAKNHLAYVREVMVKPQSYGGGTEGHNIPYNVSEDGASLKGYVTAESLMAGNPTFTAGELPEAMSLNSSSQVAGSKNVKTE